MSADISFIYSSLREQLCLIDTVIHRIRVCSVILGVRCVWIREYFAVVTYLIIDSVGSSSYVALSYRMIRNTRQISCAHRDEFVRLSAQKCRMRPLSFSVPQQI
jgi:hypothetical protein